MAGCDWLNKRVFFVLSEAMKSRNPRRFRPNLVQYMRKPRFKSCLSSHVNLVYKITWTWPTSAAILHSHSSTHKPGSSVGLRHYTILPPKLNVISTRNTLRQGNLLWLVKHLNHWLFSARWRYLALPFFSVSTGFNFCAINETTAHLLARFYSR